MTISEEVMRLKVECICMLCDWNEIGSSLRMDGRQCPNCRGPVFTKPIEKGETMNKTRDGIDVEELEQQRCMRKKTLFTNMKLQYLDRLNALIHSPITNTERSEVRRRAESLCDSIEDDLNINGDDTKPIGELHIKVDADLSSVTEELKKVWKLMANETVG